MAFTEKEKREWLANRKSGLRHYPEPPAVFCAHCGHPAPNALSDSIFPLCDACDD